MEPNHENGGKFKKILFNEITLIFAVCSVVLSGFIYLTNPQQQSNTAIELLKERINQQDKTIETITKTQQNDTQEVKSNVNNLGLQIQSLQMTVVELKTIINERIPKK